ncbi:MAG: copper resistance protein B [Boseongicola sp.]|nr:copper resistance protein B [Boseongicola sp.]
MRIKSFLVAGAVVAALAATPVSAQETNLVYYGFQLEEFEHRVGDESEELLVWNGDTFVGTDELKLRLLSEGEYDTNERKFETLENRLVLQMPVSDFFDVKAGVRADTPKGKSRLYGVLGLTGLAKQWIEVDADLFGSDKGDASARLDAEYELLLTNRITLTPSADLNVAFSDDRKMGVGSGFSSAEVGLRLSYDILDRLLSPYVGVVWERKFGETADFAREEGEDVEAWFFAIGMKVLF